MFRRFATAYSDSSVEYCLKPFLRDRLTAASAFADKLVQNVARHLDVVARNAERRDDVLLRVAFLHQPGNVLQVDVFVWHVCIVVVGCGDAATRHCRCNDATVQVVVVAARAAASVAVTRAEVDVFVEERIHAGFGGGGGSQCRRQLGRGDGFGWRLRSNLGADGCVVRR